MPLNSILIAGATASGKSALALKLADRIGGAIINADSMQVYRDLRILTARPNAEEEARVPHWLYGHVPATEAYSAGRFAQDAFAAVEAARAAGQVPIITGGTGLYFKVLLEGLSPVPPVKPEVRAYWREEAERIEATALHNILRTRDPEMARRLRPTDPQRIVRALEVFESSERSLAYWQAQPGIPVIDPNAALKIVVERPRAELWARADARLDAMIEEGALDEVRQLAALQLAPTLPVMRALGVAPLLDFLAGTSARESAIARAKIETRQFIKRQQTWIRSHMIAWNHVTW